MHIVATPVRAGDLRAGELFSTADPGYWAGRDRFAVGEKVYVRTEAPAALAPDGDAIVYRIGIDRGEPVAPADLAACFRDCYWALPASWRAGLWAAIDGGSFVGELPANPKAGLEGACVLFLPLEQGRRVAKLIESGELR
jgi:hypothetical protein